MKGSLGEGRHWCDIFVYEVVLCSLVDIIDSKEGCIKKISYFIHAVDGEAIENATIELEVGKFVSFLIIYFDSDNYASDANYDRSDVVSLDPPTDYARIQRKKNFIDNSWEVYRIDVINNKFAPFCKLLESVDNWLLAASVVNIVEIVRCLAMMYKFLTN